MPTLRTRRGIVSGTEGGTDGLYASAVLLVWCRFGHRAMANASERLDPFGLFVTDATAFGPPTYTKSASSADLNAMHIKVELFQRAFRIRC